MRTATRWSPSATDDPLIPVFVKEAGQEPYQVFGMTEGFIRERNAARVEELQTRVNEIQSLL